MIDLFFAVINLTNFILFFNNIINFNNFLCISCTMFVWRNYFIVKYDKQVLGMRQLDINEIVGLIDSVGFPIAMCLLLMFFLYKYIVPVINESIAANKEITKNLTLINERTFNIERDVDNIKTDVINIKNDVNDLKNQKNNG